MPHIVWTATANGEVDYLNRRYIRSNSIRSGSLRHSRVRRTSELVPARPSRFLAWHQADIAIKQQDICCFIFFFENGRRPSRFFLLAEIYHVNFSISQSSNFIVVDGGVHCNPLVGYQATRGFLNLVDHYAVFLPTAIGTFKQWSCNGQVPWKTYRVSMTEFVFSLWNFLKASESFKSLPRQRFTQKGFSNNLL